jgi:hypothetical protein
MLQGQPTNSGLRKGNVDLPENQVCGRILSQAGYELFQICDSLEITYTCIKSTFLKFWTTSNSLVAIQS